MSAPVIEVDIVTKHFDEVHAVNGVTLQVPAGKLFGLIGHNGAGKSTLIKLMLGLIAPDTGTIRIMGKPVLGDRFREVRRHIGYLPENISLYDNLTGLETLQFFAQLKGANPDRIAALLEAMHLTHAARRTVRTYSKGMRQRLGFAQALLGEPQVLFLDEPTSGLDPEGIREFYNRLTELTGAGVTILLSSHHLAQIQDRVDALALIRNGCLQACGSVQELRDGLDMPVTIRLRTADQSAATLRNLLGDLPSCRVTGSGEGELLVSCGSRDKVAVLSRILAGGRGLSDLHVQEPTLEDVFLGYSTDLRDNHARHI